MSPRACDGLGCVVALPGRVGLAVEPVLASAQPVEDRACPVRLAVKASLGQAHMLDDGLPETYLRRSQLVIWPFTTAVIIA